MHRSLLLQIILLQAGYATVRPMASYRAIELGAGPAQLGLVAASFSVLPLIGAFSVGRRADLWGPARLMAGGCAVVVGGSVLALLGGNLVTLLLACVVLGFGHLVAVLAQQSAVAARSGSRSDQAFGTFTSAVAIGGVLGPPTAGMTAQAWAGPGALSEAVVGLVVASAFAFLALPICIAAAWRQPQHRPAGAVAETSRVAAKGIVTTPGMWQAMLVSGAVVCAVELLLAFLPAWAEDRGISIAIVGWMLAVRAATTVGVRLLTERLVRALGRRSVLAGSVFLAAAAFGSMPFSATISGFALMIVLGIGLGLAQPLTMSWITVAVASQRHGAALGMRMSFNRLAQVTIPVTIGALAAGSGSDAVFWTIGLILGCAAGLVVRAPISQ